MSFAIWMVLIASLMPYICVTIARRNPAAPHDNNAPRPAADRLTGWRLRLDWAHRNHFEAFGPFAAAVLFAIVMQVPPIWVNGLAGLFVAIRIVYNLAYVYDQASLRSTLWTLGYLVVLALFVMAALR